MVSRAVVSQRSLEFKRKIVVFTLHERWNQRSDMTVNLSLCAGSESRIFLKPEKVVAGGSVRSRFRFPFSITNYNSRWPAEISQWTKGQSLLQISTFRTCEITSESNPQIKSTNLPHVANPVGLFSTPARSPLTTLVVMNHVTRLTQRPCPNWPANWLTKPALHYGRDNQQNLVQLLPKSENTFRQSWR